MENTKKVLMVMSQFSFDCIITNYYNKKELVEIKIKNIKN